MDIFQALSKLVIQVYYANSTICSVSMYGENIEGTTDIYFLNYMINDEKCVYTTAMLLLTGS